MTLFFGALLAVLAVAMPTSAGAATSSPPPYPPPTCGQFSVSTTVAKPGDSITVSGTGFTAHTTVKIVFAPPKKTLATVTTDASGKFTTTITLPDYPGGSYTLTAVAGGLTCPIDPIRIVVSGTSGSGSKPANTGVDVELLAAVAGVLLLGGVLFTRAGRRRRTGHHHI